MTVSTKTGENYFLSGFGAVFLGYASSKNQNETIRADSIKQKKTVSQGFSKKETETFLFSLNKSMQFCVLNKRKSNLPNTALLKMWRL